jgi:hypothetical protein
MLSKRRQQKRKGGAMGEQKTAEVSLEEKKRIINEKALDDAAQGIPWPLTRFTLWCDPRLNLSYIGIEKLLD